MVRLQGLLPNPCPQRHVRALPQRSQGRIQPAPPGVATERTIKRHGPGKRSRLGYQFEEVFTEPRQVVEQRLQPGPRRRRVTDLQEESRLQQDVIRRWRGNPPLGGGPSNESAGCRDRMVPRAAPSDLVNLGPASGP